jgi:CubicO group peptidase (beta-lactamase class C family)
VISVGSFREAMERFAVPGAAVGIVHGDEEEVAGFGVTSLENPLPVNGDTLFQVGSITKTFTATAVMRLVEAGQLNLNEPVRTYLPDLRLADDEVARAVTMRHLLTHTGGWVGDYFASISRGDEALTEMVRRLHRLEQLTPLGQVWSYNNAGFYIAGRVMEVITGKPFEAGLRELVLNPVGMKRAFFLPEDAITQRLVVGHDRTGAVSRPWALGRPAAPIGGLITSVRELLRYARLQWESGSVLSDESLAEMRRPHAELGWGPGRAMGLGWFLLERDGYAFVTHTGATAGQHALLLIAPQERFALAALTNHDDGPTLYRELEAHVLETELKVEATEDDRLELTPRELSEYAGAYDAALQTVHLSVDGGSLILEVIPKGGFPEPDSPPRPGPAPTRLAFHDKDAVVALDQPLKGERSDFLRESNQAIQWYRLGGRLHRRIADGRFQVREALFT